MAGQLFHLCCAFTFFLPTPSFVGFGLGGEVKAGTTQLKQCLIASVFPWSAASQSCCWWILLYYICMVSGDCQPPRLCARCGSIPFSMRWVAVASRRECALKASVGMLNWMEPQWLQSRGGCQSPETMKMFYSRIHQQQD